MAKRLSPTRAKFSWAVHEGHDGALHPPSVSRPTSSIQASFCTVKTSTSATFLDADTRYFYAIDAFNESGITQGEVKQMEG